MWRWDTIDAAYDATYGRDIADDIFRRRKSWRWIEVRLNRLLTGDTPTAKLYAHDQGLTPTQAAPQQRKEVLTPEGVFTFLAAGAKKT